MPSQLSVRISLKSERNDSSQFTYALHTQEAATVMEYPDAGLWRIEKMGALRGCSAIFAFIVSVHRFTCPL